MSHGLQAMLEGSTGSTELLHKARGFDEFLAAMAAKRTDARRDFWVRVRTQQGAWVYLSEGSTQAALSTPANAALSTEFLNGRKYLTVALPHKASGLTVEILFKIDAQPMAGLQVASAVTLGIGAGLFTLLLALLLGSVRAGLRPLRTLAEQLQLRQADDLRPIEAQDEHLELRPLIQAFNATLDRLALVLQRERDFLADAAHELRTPLAVLRAQIDSLSAKDDEQVHVKNRMEAGVDRASRMVEQLLCLIRLEAGHDTENSSFDLAELTRDALVAIEPLATASNASLAYEGPDHHWIQDAAAPIELVLNNLLSNALRHGGPAVQVTVKLELDGPVQRLAVTDNGPGIPGDDQSMSFKRFRRVGQNRSSNGSGLGFAIAQAAALRLHGQLSLHSSVDGNGTVAVLEWPSKPPDATRSTIHLQEIL
jgi:two-component system sensor histidine kinase QseC